MRRYSFISLIFLIFVSLFGVGVIMITKGRTMHDRRHVIVKDVVDKPDVEKEGRNDSLPEAPSTYVMPQQQFVSQSFNNCGPASLSMAYSLLGVTVTQEELAERLRPFNNPAGGVDDKSVFPEEFVVEARERGYLAMQRPNGTNEMLQSLVSQNIPVIVRTWLNEYEDIGHFRVVRGYDSAKQNFIVDDSYNGPNIQMSYESFNSLWQPFNYSYIVIYPKEKEEIVEQILGDEMDEKIAWQHALARADKEKVGAINFYPAFNSVTAKYHLGDSKGAISEYEAIASSLPGRMFWYQLEPIRAYLQEKNYEKVFEMTDAILNSGNQAYSELYLFRGEVYNAQGNTESGRIEYDKAVFYNRNIRLPL